MLDRRRSLPALAALALLVTPAAAGAQVVDAPDKPLVYVFVVDGLDGDAVDPVGAPFLTSLIAGEEDNRATYYEESRSLITAETNTNHVGMATGAFGNRSGNPGNSFAVYDEDDKADCDGDLSTTSETATGPDGPPETVDGEEPACVRAETFFAGIERQAGADLTTAGIFGKPKLAAIFAGKEVDGETYDADFLFTPCTPGADPEPYCRGTGRVPDGYALTDDQVMDEVIRTVDDGVPADGRTKRPNVTFVNLPTVDSVGHQTGGVDESAPYRAALTAADLELREFVDHQKALGLWERTTMFVVSDHAMDTTRFGPAPIGPLLDADPRTQGRFLVVNNGSVDMVYLLDRDAADAEEVLAAAREIATALPQVDEALYREPNALDGDEDHTLDAEHPEWRIAGERTGDLYVTADPGNAFDAAAVALTGNHGSPFTSDNFFVVASGGDQVLQQRLAGVQGERFDDSGRNPDQPQNADVGPSVMALLGCRPLRDADPDARVLAEAFGPLTAGGCRRDGDGDGGRSSDADSGSDGEAQSAADVAAPLTAPPVSQLGSGRPAVACDVAAGLTTTSATPLDDGGLRLAFTRSSLARSAVQVDVFQQSVGRRILGNRLVARFRRSEAFTWSGAGTRAAVHDGFFVVRLRVRLAGGRLSERRIALQRVDGRFRVRPVFDRAPSCSLLLTAKLEAAVLGGTVNRDLAVAFRLARTAQVGITVLDDDRVVASEPATSRAGGLTHRVRIAAEPLPRGRDLVVRLDVRDGAERVVERLTVRRL